MGSTSIRGWWKGGNKDPVLIAANPKKGNNTKFDPLSNLTFAQQAGMKDSTMSRLDVPIVMIDSLLSEDEEERRQ